jgi:class 3 adenylate cyclase/CHASE2 domain-containing sensor protein
VSFKRIKVVPILIVAGVIGLMCLLQFLSLKFASPAGVVRKLAPAAAGVKEPFYFDAINELEWKTYDWRMKEASRRAVSTNDASASLGLVACGDSSVAVLLDGLLGEDLRYGLLWPRQLYGRLTRELRAQGAKLIAFDIMLGELRPDHPALKLGGGRFMGSDTFFAGEVARAGNVVLAITPSVVPPDLFRTNTYELGEVTAEKDGDGILRRERAFRDYRIWHRLLVQWARLEEMDLDKAVVTGKQLKVPPARGKQDQKTVVLALDDQGELDLRPFYQALEEPLEEGQPVKAKPFTPRRVWSMGVVMAASELGLDLARAEVDLAGRRIRLPGTNGVERILPVEPSGHLYVDWRLKIGDPRLLKATFEGLLAMHVLRESGETNELKAAWGGKVAIVGSTATGSNLTDLGATSLENEAPLLGKHWNVANSIILNQFVHRSPYLLELALIVLLGGASGWLTWRLRVLWASFWVVAMILLYVGVSLGLFVAFRYWLPIVLPVGGALLATHVCTVTYRVIFEQAERRRVKSVFSKIVSPDVVNELLQQEKLGLGGARRGITVLFADVRGFTQMTDENQRRAEEYVAKNKLTGDAAEAFFDESARETLATVNLYLATIADNVKKHKGTLDKYIGDCVMAFWGAPTPNEAHAAACVRAAVDSQRAMYELNLQRAEENKRREQENAARLTGGQPPRPMLALLSLGTGINSGVVTVGLMGSDAHILNYTVFGREVNLASRLEGVSGRGRIIISDATFAELQRHAPELAATCASLPPVTVKGISQAVKIFEVPWRPPSKPAAPADKPAAPSASAAPAMTGSSAAPGAGTLPGSGGAPGSPGKN